MRDIVVDRGITKIRYFILGLVVTLFLSAYLFQYFVPPGTLRPMMWTNVHLALEGGCFTLITIGAAGGFGISTKLLSPLWTFIISIAVGVTLTVLSLTEINVDSSLETVGVVLLLFGFLGGWAVVEFFGKDVTNRN